MFASRTDWSLTPNRLSVVIAERRAKGLPFIDLTQSNPTHCGFSVNTRGVLAALANSSSLAYEPDPHGPLYARRAVAGYYAERDIQVDPEQIFLTTSTSEAYSYVFRLLANPGDNVLVPRPSYPLFDFLARLNDLELLSYPLIYDQGWQMDVQALPLRLNTRTKAVLVVHPNNPTGSFVRRDEAAALAALARDRGLALIVDEVFGDYARDPAGLPEGRLPSFVEQPTALTFVLSGLSKITAMPQVKLGWIVTTGPDDLAREALARLEVVADTYLSVSTPVQLALPAILAERGPIQARILARTRRNLAALDATIEALGPEAPVRRLPVDGGWYATIEVPRTRDEDAWVELLLREDGVVVHPGYFFDFEEEGYLVVSLLPEEAAFGAAIERVARRVAAA